MLLLSFGRDSACCAEIVVIAPRPRSYLFHQSRSISLGSNPAANRSNPGLFTIGIHLPQNIWPRQPATTRILDPPVNCCSPELFILEYSSEYLILPSGCKPKSFQKCIPINARRVRSSQSRVAIMCSKWPQSNKD